MGSGYPERKESPLVSDTVTRPRETQRTFGRVYQTSLDQSEVVIDWQPASPIMGCKVLTHGRAVYHPTEGKVVRFPGAWREDGRPGRLWFGLNYGMTSSSFSTLP